MAPEPLVATVRARVPEQWGELIERHAETLSQSGMRVTPADVLRVALHEFFAKRRIKIGAATHRRNGKDHANG